MKLRFQMGSNRPFAKRKARMFWAASLAEEVIDAEDLVLREDLVQVRVQRHRAFQVSPEGLLHDDARSFDEARSANIRTAESAAFGGTLR